MRIFRHYVPKSVVILSVIEASVLFGAFYLAVTIRFWDWDLHTAEKLMVGHTWTKAAAYTLLMMLIMAVMGLYEREVHSEMRGMFLRVAATFLLGALLTVVGISVFPWLSISSEGVVLVFVFSALGLLMFRMLVSRFVEHSLFKRNVLVLGTGDRARQIEQLWEQGDLQGLSLIGYVRSGNEQDKVKPEQILVKKGSLLHLALEHNVDEMVVAIADQRAGFPINEILDCKMSGFQVVDLVTFFEQATGKIHLDVLKPSDLIFADGFIQAVLKGYIHRAFDIFLSLAVLMITWPLMGVTALAIWVESKGKGSIFYKQVRVGRNGRPFQILKFRSMRENAEQGGKAQWAKINDNRITRVGSFIRRTRIDELPQLLNVLKGDMSFVGPRPERPPFVADLLQKIPYYDLRHRVNPGITGWAQICYPYGASAEDAKEKLQYDLYYIKNYSLFLDLMILIQTIQVVLWGKGAR